MEYFCRTSAAIIINMSSFILRIVHDDVSFPDPKLIDVDHDLNVCVEANKSFVLRLFLVLVPFTTGVAATRTPPNRNIF